MFADAGQWVAAVLALCWAVTVLHGVRQRRTGGPAPESGVLAALGVAVLLFFLQSRLGDRIVDAGRGATRLDAAVWAAAVRDRTPGLTAFAEVLNVAGGMLALGVVAVLAAGVLQWRGRRVEAALMASAPAAGGLLDLGFKLGYARPRPPESAHLVEVTGFSLPSGHTLDATVVLGTLALVTVVALRRRAARIAVAVLAATLIAVAGGARVYLGVHWLTDVVTGWLLGGAWVAACAAVLLVVPDDRAAPLASGGADGGPGVGAGPRPWRVEAVLY